MHCSHYVRPHRGLGSCKKHGEIVFGHHVTIKGTTASAYSTFLRGKKKRARIIKVHAYRRAFGESTTNQLMHLTKMISSKHASCEESDLFNQSSLIFASCVILRPRVLFLKMRPSLKIYASAGMLPGGDKDFFIKGRFRSVIVSTYLKHLRAAPTGQACMSLSNVL